MHPDLFRNAGRKFRTIPVHSLERKRHNRTRTAEEVQAQLNRLVEREQKQRVTLTDAGIDYEFPGYVECCCRRCVCPSSRMCV